MKCVLVACLVVAVVAAVARAQCLGLGNGFSAHWTQLNGPDALPSPSNGQVVAVGTAFYLLGDGFTTMWRFAESSKGWTAIPKPTVVPQARTNYAITSDGTNIFVFGGCIPAGSGPKCAAWLNDLWQFDTKTQAWTQLCTKCEHLPTTRELASAAAVPSGILIFGGQYSGATDFNDVWLYNTTGATFVNLCDASSCGTAPAGRVGASFAQSAGDDSALVFGGLDQARHSFNDTWHVYVDTPGSWGKMTTATPPPDSRSRAALLSVNVNENVLFGGVLTATQQSSNDVWIFSPYCLDGTPRHRLAPSNGGGWTHIPNAGSKVPSHRYGSALIANDEDGSLYMAGGVDASGKVLADVWQLVFE